jgi:hypothetical protein
MIMPRSIYCGKEMAADQMCVSIVAQGGGSGGYLGHAHLAFEWRDMDTEKWRHVVYHLVGSRRESLGGGHIVYNVASVEKIEQTETQQGYYSCGGRSGRPVRDEVDTPSSWYNQESGASASVIVSIPRGHRALTICGHLAGGQDDPHHVKSRHFSLVGASVKLGTNCITFTRQVLKTIGVKMDWKMYILSFASPYEAVKVGSLYKTRWNANAG